MNLESQDQSVMKGFTPAAFLKLQFSLVVEPSIILHTSAGSLNIANPPLNILESKLTSGIKTVPI